VLLAPCFCNTHNSTTTTTTTTTTARRASRQGCVVTATATPMVNGQRRPIAAPDSSSASDMCVWRSSAAGHARHLCGNDWPVGMRTRPIPRPPVQLAKAPLPAAGEAFDCFAIKCDERSSFSHNARSGGRPAAYVQGLPRQAKRVYRCCYLVVLCDGNSAHACC
jgi:hypothetical protein